MDLYVYLWVEDITVFIRELIRIIKILRPANKMIFTEEYDVLDGVLDREIYLKGSGIDIDICDYQDISFALEEYGTDVNIYLLFYDIDFDGTPEFIAALVNWIMRTSDTDLVIQDEGGMINFKRVQGKIYYGKESDFWPIDYIPVKDLDFDREKAIEFTHDDEWVFCSEEHIQKMERWRKKKEKLEESD